MRKGGYFYIVTNRDYGTLYIGVTTELIRRIHEHREGVIEGFTKKYGLKRLVYYEFHEELGLAIAREKDVKRWKRNWKINLIERSNPTWRDLWSEIIK